MDVVAKILIAIAVVIVVARLFGHAVRLLGQPQVMGEIVAGITLGPSVLGVIWPGAQEWLFPDEILPFLNIIAQLGLIFFMFLVGLELDAKLLRGHGRTVGFVLPLSLGLPFLLGVVVGLGIHGTLAPDIDRLGFVLFLGTALAITAFPVLARLLNEKGLNKSPVGAIALTCAAIEDVCAWMILAVVVAIVRSGGAADTLLTILYTAIFAGVMMLGVRPALAWLVPRWSRGPGLGGLGAGLLTLILAGVLVSAWITEEIGIHAVFGAFLFGAILPRTGGLVQEVTLKIEDFTLLLFLPVFFAITGLRTELQAIDSATVGYIGLLVLAAAIVGKYVAGTAGALMAGMPFRDSSVLGLLLNTRGLTELVIITIGKELGVVPDSLFAILVIMALVTTFMAAPLIDLTYRYRPEVAPAPASGRTAPQGGPQHVLVALDGTRADVELVELAVRLTEASGGRVTLARLIPQPERLARRTSMWDAEAAESAAQGRLAEIVEEHPDRLGRIDTIVDTVPDVGIAVVNQTGAVGADLVLVGWNRSLLGTNVLGGAVGRVLAEAPADVAVLVDQAGRGVALERGQTVVVPYGAGVHEHSAVKLATFVAEASGAPLEIVARDQRAQDMLAEAEAAGVRVSLTEDESPRRALAAALERAGLLVIGAGEDWAYERASFGGSRGRLVAGIVTPVLVVREGDLMEPEKMDVWLKSTRRSQLGDWLGSRIGSVPGAPAPGQKTPG
jgi:Kef-type K+ transport system membrane component KefB